MNIQRLQRDSLPLGGFEGITERRLIVDQRIGGDSHTWEGFGNFVYLADARYKPNGESKMHSHKELDVISVIINGRVNHEGSMKHGQSLVANQAQAQRAGGEGFSHNEINPDNHENRMLQLWVLPEQKGEPASYKFYDLEEGGLTRIYGGDKKQTHTLDSQTIIEFGRLFHEQTVTRNSEVLLYLVEGKGAINNELFQEGDLIRTNNLEFVAEGDAQIVIISIEAQQQKEYLENHE